MDFDAKGEAAKLVRVEPTRRDKVVRVHIGDVSDGDFPRAAGESFARKLRAPIASALSRAYAAGLDRAADIASETSGAYRSEDWRAACGSCERLIRGEAEKARTP